MTMYGSLLNSKSKKPDENQDGTRRSSPLQRTAIYRISDRREDGAEISFRSGSESSFYQQNFTQLPLNGSRVVALSATPEGSDRTNASIVTQMAEKTGKYIPPQKRGVATPVTASSTRTLVDSDVAHALYLMLEELSSTDLELTSPKHQGSSIRFTLNHSFNREVSGKSYTDLPIFFHVHNYESKDAYLGSIWVGGVGKDVKSGINAQTNPKAGTLMRLFQQWKEKQ